MSKQDKQERTFYEGLTCRYFTISKERLERAIDYYNSQIRAGIADTEGAIKGLYASLGLWVPENISMSTKSRDEFTMDDLMIREVEDPETNNSTKEMEMEKKVIEFEEFNVEVTTKSVCDPITLLFKVSGDEEIEFSLSKDNAKTMIKFLKAAVKLT